MPEPISGHFEELRALCEVTGDKSSLAVGMYGLASEHMFNGRVREAARVASEQMELLETIGDPTMMIGVAFLTIGVKLETGEMHDMLRLAQPVIDWADGDPLKGNIILGSPLAVALVWRGVARCELGRQDGRQDIDDAISDRARRRHRPMDVSGQAALQVRRRSEARRRQGHWRRFSVRRLLDRPFFHARRRNHPPDHRAGRYPRDPPRRGALPA